MKNIIHYGKYFYPESGGIESVTYSLAIGAKRSGHKVRVVCFTKDSSSSADVVDDVEVYRAPVAFQIASQPLSFKYLVNCISCVEEPDIVHLHAPNILGMLAVLLLNRKVKILVHWHSDIINKGVLGYLIRPLEFLTLKRANSIVATSDAYANASLLLSGFRKKISVIPIGVPQSCITCQCINCEFLNHPKLKNKKLILSVGRLVPYKGFGSLVEAAKDVSNDAIIVIVGAGPLQNVLQNAIDSANLKERIVILGKLDYNCLHKLFKQATLFCLPSLTRAEAFGVVLIEAMSHGLPLVTCDIPGSGVSWINKNGETGIVVPLGSPSLIAYACNKIIASDSIRAAYSKASYARYLAEFTEDLSVNRFLKLYYSLH